MGYINAQDTIRGTDGTLYWKVGDTEYPIFYAKNIEINLEINQDDIQVIGTRIVQKKVSSVSVSGSATLYFGSNNVKQMITEYLKGKAYPRLELVVQNNDPDSQRGPQIIHCYGVQITNIPLAKLDAETSAIEEDIEFTINGYSITTPFKDNIDQETGQFEEGDISI